MPQTVSDEFLASYMTRFRSLINSAKFEAAAALAETMRKKHPRVLIFEYHVAVMTAEDDVNFSEAENRIRYRKAAGKLKTLLRKLRGAQPTFRAAVRNEYYWFSQQPLKQYKVGLEAHRAKDYRRSAYSRGVGAAMLAKKYALRQSLRQSLRWAKISEKAWLDFFAIDPEWSNCYIFYAIALGLQNRFEDMESSLFRYAKLSGKKKNWIGVTKCRREILEIIQQRDHRAMSRSRPKRGAALDSRR